MTTRDAGSKLRDSDTMKAPLKKYPRTTVGAMMDQEARLAKRGIPPVRAFADHDGEWPKHPTHLDWLRLAAKVPPRSLIEKFMAERYVPDYNAFQKARGAVGIRRRCLRCWRTFTLTDKRAIYCDAACTRAAAEDARAPRQNFESEATKRALLKSNWDAHRWVCPGCNNNKPCADGLAMFTAATRRRRLGRSIPA